MAELRQAIRDVLGMADPGLMAAGRARSPHWSRVQKAHLRRNPTCAVCGCRHDLNVHHVLPYHLYPEKELDRENLITLCRGHHFLFGHLEDFKAFNPLVGPMRKFGASGCRPERRCWRW